MPKVTISGWRWGTWWQMSKGTRETMTGAHLGGRGAGRRRGNTAEIATRGIGRRRGHGDGRHHVDLWRTLFCHVLATYTRRKKCDRFVLMDSWTRPNVSKLALVRPQKSSLTTATYVSLSSRSATRPMPSSWLQLGRCRVSQSSALLMPRRSLSHATTVSARCRGAARRLAGPSRVSRRSRQ